MTVPFRADPGRPGRYLYKLKGMEWSCNDLAYRAGVSANVMRQRLAHWDEIRIMEPIIDAYRQTADFRAGKPLKPRKGI